MVPVFRMKNRTIRIGPSAVHPDGDGIFVSPWLPEIDAMFPLSRFSLTRPPWRSVAWLVQNDRMIWALRVRTEMNRNPQGILLILSPEGDLIRSVRVMHPDRHLWRSVMTFGDRVFAFGAMLRIPDGTEVHLPADPEIRMFLRQDRACPGPDGVLVLPDGRLVEEGRRLRQLFHASRVMEEIRHLSGIPSVREEDIRLYVLSWDGSVLWLPGWLSPNPAGVFS